MLGLNEFKDWLKEQFPYDHYYVGKLDQKQEKSIGVYGVSASGSPIIALGGLANTSYDIKRISLLVHGTKRISETEPVAMRLYDMLLGARPEQIGGVRIFAILVTVPEPQYVGSDDDGIMEYVITLEIYHERSKYE